MADNDNANDSGTVESQPIKSTTDLELEKLTARLDALESENRELRNANQGLWASLHPVQATESENVINQPATDGAYDAFAERMGWKTKEV